MGKQGTSEKKKARLEKKKKANEKKGKEEEGEKKGASENRRGKKTEIARKTVRKEEFRGKRKKKKLSEPLSYLNHC